MKKIAEHLKLKIQPVKEVISDTDTFDHLRYTSSVETQIANIFNLKIHIQPAIFTDEDLTINLIFFGTAGQVISEPFILKKGVTDTELSLPSIKPEYQIIDVNRIAFRCEKQFEADITIYDISKNEDPAVRASKEGV